MDSFNKTKHKKGGGKRSEKQNYETISHMRSLIQILLRFPNFFVIVHRLFIPTKLAKFIRVWLPTGKLKKTQPSSI